MTGEITQFLLLGTTYGHIPPVLDRFNTKHVVIFTSRDLDNSEFLNRIQSNYDAEVDVILLDPFESNAVERMTAKILDTAAKLEVEPIIISGVTGGTNLMAISMALASSIKGWKCHYVLRSDDKDRILDLDIFHRINTKISEVDITDILEVAQ